MVDREELLDRFGDEEFLHELWMKTRRQLPEYLKKIETVLDQNPPDAEEQLAPLLHRLRGLIANFLESGESVSSVRRLETLVREGGHPPQEKRQAWDTFRRHLERETEALEQWLDTAGFPCS